MKQFRGGALEASCGRQPHLLHYALVVACGLYYLASVGGLGLVKGSGTLSLPMVAGAPIGNAQ